MFGNIKNYSYIVFNKHTKGKDFLKSKNKMATQTNNTEELSNAIDNLSEEMSSLKYLIKSDYTGWNLTEAIENLSFELKRLNDREELKK